MKTPLLRKLCLVLPAVLAMLALGACGDSHTKVTTGTYAGESGANAPYLNVGPLIYEVQLSRELNPQNPEDAAYLTGLGAAESKLEPGQEWFGVFVQVYNNTSGTLQSASNITVSDTQGNVYSPIVPATSNAYAYRAGPVAAKSLIPAPATTAANGPTQGALLLFKIQVVSLDNRPLTIKIVDPDNSADSATAELDV
jgi:hypothetical protein